MQMPQIVLFIPNLLFANSRAVFMQAKALKNESRYKVIFQFSPVEACAGHTSTHLVQVPQREASIGIPTDKSASVSTVVIRTAEPNCFVTSKAVFPIQPRPALVAVVL